MGGLHPLRRRPTHGLDPAGLRPRLPRARRRHRGAIQDDRVLGARARARRAVERSRHRHPLAAQGRADPLAPRREGREARGGRSFRVKVLLTGRNGQVGWELERLLDDAVATDRGTLDLSNEQSIRETVREAKPAIVVNAAAYTAVDKAESEKDLAMQINGVAPGILADEAKRLGALLVHYSTDYVFDGEKRTAYVEDDRTNPLSVYGASKLEGERRILASGCRHLILRTSWVYAARGKNFYLTMKSRAGQALRVVDDQRGVPTSSRFLAEKTVALLGKAEGVLHLVPSGATTWYGFAREILGVKADITPIRSSEYKTPARRPANSVLDNGRAQALLGRQLPDWRDVLAAMR